MFQQTILIHTVPDVNPTVNRPEDNCIQNDPYPIHIDRQQQHCQQHEAPPINKLSGWKKIHPLPLLHKEKKTSPVLMMIHMVIRADRESDRSTQIDTQTRDLQQYNKTPTGLIRQDPFIHFQVQSLYAKLS